MALRRGGEGPRFRYFLLWVWLQPRPQPIRHPRCVQIYLRGIAIGRATVSEPLRYTCFDITHHTADTALGTSSDLDKTVNHAVTDTRGSHRPQLDAR